METLEAPTALFPAPTKGEPLEYIVKAYPEDIILKPREWRLPDLPSAIYLAWELARKRPWHQVYVMDTDSRQFASFNAMWDFERGHNVGTATIPDQPA